MPLSLWTCRLSSGLPFPPVSFKSAFSPAPPTAVSSGLFTLLHFPVWHVRHCIGFVCDFSCLLPSRWLRTGRHSLTARRIPARQRSYRSPPNTALSLCEFEFGGSLGGGGVFYTLISSGSTQWRWSHPLVSAVSLHAQIDLWSERCSLYTSCRSGKPGPCDLSKVSKPCSWLPGKIKMRTRVLLCLAEPAFPSWGGYSDPEALSKLLSINKDATFIGRERTFWRKEPHYGNEAGFSLSSVG